MEKKQIIKNIDTQFDVAIRYFKVIAAVNNIKLQNRQLELLAFISLRGGVFSGSARQKFIEVYGSTYHTINNMLGQLYKKKFLLRDSRKYTINPQLMVSDFSNMILVINLTCLKKES